MTRKVGFAAKEIVRTVEGITVSICNVANQCRKPVGKEHGQSQKPVESNMDKARSPVLAELNTRPARSITPATLQTHWKFGSFINFYFIEIWSKKA